MSELTREQKMSVVLYIIKDRFDNEVTDIIGFHSVEVEDKMPAYQVTQLLELLQKKYKCIKFEEKPSFKTKEEAIATMEECGVMDDIEDEVDFERELSRFLSQKTYSITPLEKFQKVLKDLTARVEAEYKLHIEIGDGSVPVLYINETPIRRFQNSSYPYRMMKLALGLPNGSVVPVKDVLKDNRGDRGCPQDLSDIFKNSALRTVFTSDVKRDSFIIVHEVTMAGLRDNKAFQELVRQNSELSDTTYLAKAIEDSRIAL